MWVSLRGAEGDEAISLPYRLNLLRHQIDQRRQAAMAGAFIDYVVMRRQVQDAHVAEGLAQQRLGIHVLLMRRAAGAEFNLFRPVALEDEQAARLYGCRDLAEDHRALRRRRELDEDG